MRGGSAHHRKDIGQVTLGPDIRRGVADLDGKGDAVGGVVIMRSGENALRVIDRVKAKMDQIQPSLPPGVKIVTTYDRSELILGSIHTLKHTLYRGNRHRQPGDFDLPLAHSQRLDSDFDDTHYGSDCLHSHESDWGDFQHHVAGGNCHCHRRHGGRGHCGGGANAQEAGDVGSGRDGSAITTKW